MATDGTLTVDYHVDANVIRLTKEVEEYAREEIDSPARIYKGSRTETDMTIAVMTTASRNSRVESERQLGNTGRANASSPF